MGELADYMIHGDDCHGCGMPFDTPGDGYPRLCTSCKPAPVRYHIKGQTPRPPGQTQVQNPPYPSKTARNRAKKARRRGRDAAARQGESTP